MAIAGGPLCSQCYRDYFLSEHDGCLVCEVQNAWVGPLILLVVVVLIGLLAVHLRDQMEKWYHRHEERLFEYGQRGTVLFGE